MHAPVCFPLLFNFFVKIFCIARDSVWAIARCSAADIPSNVTELLDIHVSKGVLIVIVEGLYSNVCFAVQLA